MFTASMKLLPAGHEAMACGTFVITGRAEATNRRDGIGQVDEVAAALGQRCPVAQPRRGMSKRPRAATFAWERAARESLESYRQTARSRAGAAAPRARDDSTAAVRAKTPPVNHAAAAKSTDVLFGQAYFLRFDPKLWEARQPYAPLGALYAAAVVRESGYRVALFDAMLASSEHEWAAALDAERPRVAVIYEDNFNT